MEAINEDGALFPYLLSFLDLSSLNLEERLPSRLPLPLLLREEYKYVSDLIKAYPRDFGGSVIISGQPGIGEFLVSCLTGSDQPCRYQGKTTYLYLKLIELMIEGRPFLFQSGTGTVYHVAKKGVEEVQSWSSKETIAAFVDGDNGIAPQPMIRQRSVQLIVASLKGTQSSWAKQLGPGSYVKEIAIKLWSRDELFLTGLVLASLSILD